MSSSGSASISRGPSSVLATARAATSRARLPGAAEHLGDGAQIEVAVDDDAAVDVEVTDRLVQAAGVERGDLVEPSRRRLGWSRAGGGAGDGGPAAAISTAGGEGLHRTGRAGRVGHAMTSGVKGGGRRRPGRRSRRANRVSGSGSVRKDLAGFRQLVHRPLPDAVLHAEAGPRPPRRGGRPTGGVRLGSVPAAGRYSPSVWRTRTSRRHVLRPAHPGDVDQRLAAGLGLAPRDGAGREALAGLPVRTKRPGGWGTAPPPGVRGGPRPRRAAGGRPASRRGPCKARGRERRLGAAPRATVDRQRSQAEPRRDPRAGRPRPWRRSRGDLSRRLGRAPRRRGF